ncbi:sulfatase-like hydrolase/transferase [Streptomyces sp. NPDC059866]|uniref:sulfatase-like hydrolase/transferase n=1 Tax=Streptomyces sp. NPDC059866 TaxID=3346978 RepID=UPI003646E104
MRYANFHVTPLCSPTRAALLTGRNSHAVGVGMVSNIDPGFPGYTSELPANQPVMAEVMRANGYSTLMVGKWHLCKDSDLNEAGDKTSWPLQRGFDQYYGFLEAMTNLHHPHRLYEGNSVVDTDRYPEGYYLTDDLTDRATRMIREVKSAKPDKPFFIYFAHGAVHAPLQVKAEHIRRQRGRYAIGWDELRARRLAPQVELGIVPEGTRLPPRNFEEGLDVQPWESYSPRERELFARYMEVYAAMVESIDQSVGRLRGLLEEMGEWENTIFIFTSDNGASCEGFDKGSTQYHRRPSAISVRARPRKPTTRRWTRTAWADPPLGRTTRAAGRWPATPRSGSTRSPPSGAVTRYRWSCPGPERSASRAASSSANTSMSRTCYRRCST